MFSSYYPPLLGLVFIMISSTGFLMYVTKGQYTFNFSTVRKGHQSAGILFLFPLLLVAATGGAYRFARAWLAFPKAEVKWMREWHVGKPLGESVHYFFPVLVGLMMLSMCFSGLYMLSSSYKKK
eukprot:TRINITY_DN8993_c0_g1_i13.p1 TRINITY_DN8993_c0_g1~~TRINITY_DN8993_c0_g1_i13.p1  ORF type:complete len:124 (+),score=23.66 TRINITY_DN8993_c0_g1_i13:304-675(+)